MEGEEKKREGEERAAEKERKVARQFQFLPDLRALTRFHSLSVHFAASGKEEDDVGW